MPRVSRWVVGWVVFDLILAGAGFYYLQFFRSSHAAVDLALEAASHSRVVARSLGGTQFKRRFVAGHVLAGAGTAKLTIYVTGSHSRGTLSEWAERGSAGWHICSLVFREHATERAVTLVDGATAGCERK